MGDLPAAVRADLSRQPAGPQAGPRGIASLARRNEPVLTSGILRTASSKPVRGAFRSCSPAYGPGMRENLAFTAPPLASGKNFESDARRVLASGMALACHDGYPRYGLLILHCP